MLEVVEGPVEEDVNALGLHSHALRKLGAGPLKPAGEFLGARQEFVGRIVDVEVVRRDQLPVLGFVSDLDLEESSRDQERAHGSLIVPEPGVRTKTI